MGITVFSVKNNPLVNEYFIFIRTKMERKGWKYECERMLMRVSKTNGQNAWKRGWKRKCKTFTTLWFLSRGISQNVENSVSVHLFPLKINIERIVESCEKHEQNEPKYWRDKWWKNNLREGKYGMKNNEWYKSSQQKWIGFGNCYENWKDRAWSIG